MIRLSFFIILLLLSFAEVVLNVKKNKIITYFLYFIFGLFLALRYGQGTDYFAYLRAYESIPYSFNNLIEYIKYERMETGYVVFSAVIKSLGINFFGFVSIISIINVILLYRFVNHFTKFKVTALLLIYSIYSMPILESAFRQSIAISIVLGIVLVAKSKDKNMSALIGVIIASLFHSSALVSIFLLLFNFKNDRIYTFFIQKKNIFIIFIILFSILNFMNIIPLHYLLPSSLFEKVDPYSDMDMNFLGILNRVIFLFFIILLAVKANTTLNLKQKNMLIIYILGFSIYIIFLKFGMISRISIYYKIVEIALIPELISNYKRIKLKSVLPTTILLVFLVTTIYVKESTTALLQGNYYNNGFYEYPYITIFNKEEIYKCRILDE